MDLRLSVLPYQFAAMSPRGRDFAMPPGYLSNNPSYQMMT
jgi:hypothetical protein